MAFALRVIPEQPFLCGRTRTGHHHDRPADRSDAPLQILLRFAFLSEAGAIDAMIDRLTVLRARMLPSPPKPGERN